MVNSRHARESGLAMGIRSVSTCLHVIVTGAFFQWTVHGLIIRGFSFVAVLWVLGPSEGGQELHDHQGQFPTSVVW